MGWIKRIKPWHYWTFAVGLALLVTVTSIFRIYAASLGGVSGTPGDWGHFGALLSGVFTLVAAVAASAAFLVTRLQMDKLVNLQSEQEKSLVFERYVKHRGLFLERCQEIESLLAGRVKFFSPAELYKKLFPLNSPSHCAYTLGPKETQELEAWSNTWSKIATALAELGRSEGRFTDSIGDTMRLAGHLRISAYSKSKISTVKFTSGGHDLGFGVYDLCRFHSDLRAVINELALFAGSDVDFKAKGGVIPLHALSWLRKSFREFRGDAGLEIVDQTPALVVLHCIYDDMEARHHEERYMDDELGTVLSNLMGAFESNEKLEAYLLSQGARDDLVRMKKLFGEERIGEYERYFLAHLN